ncbi:MAG: hypothetical protein K2X82_04175, partial [Gemmataceae bacterium]|nr:hypothetical protein [Gemmataceae bacterium]
LAFGAPGPPPAAAMKQAEPPGAAGRAVMGDGDKSKADGPPKAGKVDSFARKTPLADQENSPRMGAAPNAEKKKTLDEAAGVPTAPADGAAERFARMPEPGGRPGEPKGGTAEDKPADGLRGGVIAPTPQTGATPLRGALGRAVVPPAQPSTLAEQPPADAPEAHARLFAAEPAVPPPVAVHLGSMRPQWLAGQDGADALFLVRAVRAGPKVSYQGVLLDWDRLKPLLLDEVKDLFPAADLVPVKDPAGVSPDRAMTALPVQLDPGLEPEPAPPGWTPLRFGLVLAWVAALIAVGAVGLAGWSLIDLSERRIRFVSAVTHELRTPLTSLRLYLDLLLSGMVTDEAKRTEYLATLNAESDRLHRLIDNVLDFARLERRRAGHALRPVPVADLLGQIRQTWGDRCGTDGKDLVVVSTLPPAAAACTDPDLFGQIVGNLVDNARKYSRGASDPRIWVWAKPAGRKRVAVEVEDRGPGVPPRERGLVFRPFRRGEGADTTAGGAGLGLALAKQWAEAVGGRLTYRPADGGVGACFRLELPAA